MPSPSLSIALMYGAMLGADCRADLSSSAPPVALPQADADVQVTMSVPIVMILDSRCAIWMFSLSALPFAGLCYSTLIAYGEWR